MTPTPDELRERGEAIVLELDYWTQVNDDARRMVEAIADAAAAVAEATVACVSAAALGEPRVLGFVSDATDSNARAMRRLSELSETLERLVELVAGRMVVLGETVDAFRRDAA